VSLKNQWKYGLAYGEYTVCLAINPTVRLTRAKATRGAANKAGFGVRAEGELIACSTRGLTTGRLAAFSLCFAAGKHSSHWSVAAAHQTLQSLSSFRRGSRHK
jgi:hypothetical protein